MKAIVEDPVRRREVRPLMLESAVVGGVRAADAGKRGRDEG
jgi:hypothetical protein